MRVSVSGANIAKVLGLLKLRRYISASKSTMFIFLPIFTIFYFGSFTRVLIAGVN